MIFYKELFHKIEKILWSVFLKPFFFSIDPEKVHHFVVGAMKLFSPIFYLRKSFYHFKINGKNHPSLEKEVFGIKFPNPVGLAAGFDKNAEVYKQMSSLGFGFIEIGTITPVFSRWESKKKIF
jgi:Dihydroorotate dehydrogenase